MQTQLLSSTSYVETPFIIATIGDYSFGVYSKETKNVIQGSAEYRSVVSTYPNYMQSLSVEKINGSLNTYTLVMNYQITQNDDPNLLEKIFSKNSKDRTIKLSYGDLSVPTYIYKEEEALITKIRSSVSISGSAIRYTLSCVSKALSLTAGTFNFGKVHMKPSDRIKWLLYNNEYGLLDIFYGMREKERVLTKNLILGDDIVVDIEAKQSISALEYLKYLVSCMVSAQDSGNSVVNKSRYVIKFIDDITNEMGGPYFKIGKISSTNDENVSSDIYVIDVGYPGQNIVISFNVEDDETYSLLSDFSGEIEQSKYIYRINNNGEMEPQYSPTLTNSSKLLKTTVADKNWWTQVTQYPIQATLTIKGLLKPTILMSYVQVNVWFYGQKHISSGVYMITKQIDNISEEGYRTTLSLTRISGV